MIRRLAAPVACLALALAAGLTTAPATAHASPVHTDQDRRDRDHADRAHHARGQRLIDRAARALTSGEESAPTPPAGAAHRADATLALLKLFRARPSLDPDQRTQAGHLLARPTDGRSDVYGDGYTVKAQRLCGPRVCVHYVTSTKDAVPNLAWVRTTLKVMNQAWSRDVRMGYHRPPSDGTRGGSKKFDVYLKQLGDQRLYGYCTPERRMAGHPKRASSYCVLDNDFSKAEFRRKPIEALRVTAGHEFFHAVQFGYDFTEDPWFLESTATWMEERFADPINDNRAYLPYSQIVHPAWSLDQFQTAGFLQYGEWIFWEYLTERYGNRIVRKVLQKAGTIGPGKNRTSIGATRAVLAEHGGFDRNFRAYASANVIAKRAYQEGHAFPKATIAQKRQLSARKQVVQFTTKINHLGARHFQINSGPSLGKKWKLQVAVDGPPAKTHPGAFLIIKKVGGTVKRRDIPLDSNGVGHIDLAFTDATVASVTLTVVNGSTRFACNQETEYSCQGTPRDDGRKFVAQAKVYR